MKVTIAVGQAPAGGYARCSWSEVICGLGHTHRGHMPVHLGRAGQLEERDVVVKAGIVVVGMPEHLTGNDIISR